MSRKSRTKGKRGERGLITVFRPFFPEAKRSWAVPQLDGDLDLGVPGLYVECRYREQIAVESWANEVEAKAASRGSIPILCWRRNRQPWRATLPASELARLLEIAHRHGELTRD